MSTNHIIALIGAALLVTAAVRGIRATIAETLPPFTVVCNDSGEYSFTDWSGRVESVSYRSRHLAEVKMAELKEWHENYERRRKSGELKTEEKREKTRALSFRPCN